MARGRKVLKWTLGTLAVLLVAVAIALFVVHEPRPSGRAGPEADALAARMEAAVNLEAWRETGAVQWTFAAKHTLLWDRERGLVRVQWDGTEVLLDESGARGRAYRDGAEVPGDDARELVEDAYGYFVNDSFWLNPIAKLRDDGVQLSTVDGGLLVSYSAGGLTPGDAYLWRVRDDGLPRAWKLWVSIIPIGGVETTWERWVTLDTGARISTLHRGPLGLTVELTDVAGGATLSELVGGADPFAPLTP